MRFVVIEKGSNITELRFGEVDFHKNLVLAGEKCLGGGFAKVKADAKQVIMWDKSHDFGYPKFAKHNVIDADPGDGDPWTGYDFYYVPDIMMPKDEDYRIEVTFEEL